MDGWRDGSEPPPSSGWYEIDTDAGRPVCLAWDGNFWWKPSPGGWTTVGVGAYRWRGPVASLTEPQPSLA